MPKRFTLPKSEYKLLCNEVFARDGWACRCCGKANIQAHHVQFRSSGGPDYSWNLVSLCSDCHSQVHGLQKSKFIIIVAKSGNPDEQPNCDEGVKFLKYGAVRKRYTWSGKKEGS